MSETKKPLVLVILDGWGFSEGKVGNPLKEANLPVLNAIPLEYPMTLLQASGPAVGMSWGETGNSEVGHLAIGAGRIIEQYHFRINHAINDTTFFNNPAIIGAFTQAKNQASRVHLIGLLTSNTVHAAFGHLVALLKLASAQAVSEVYLHLFTDGRDSGLQEATVLLTKLNAVIAEVGIGKIATLIGRDFAMDRDNNWQLTEQAYQLIASGQGEKTEEPIGTLSQYYQTGVNDSHIPPLVITGSGFSGLAANDSLIFFNFREDSMRQIMQSFSQSDFSIFPRQLLPNLYIASMTKYLPEQVQAVAFPPPVVTNNLPEYLSRQNKNQFHIAETDKYAHVTFFFNGLQNAAFPGETDIFVDSVKNIEAQPAMASAEITDKILAELATNNYDFFLINFANADMLAHTGNYPAVIQGAEAVDTAIGIIKAKVSALGGTLLITADHGNAESLVYKSGGEAETKHNDSPVFFYLVAEVYRRPRSIEELTQAKTEVNGILPDIAPTILELLGLPKPEEMTGQSLLPLLVK